MNSEYDDLKYFQYNMFKSLKIPSSFKTEYIASDIEHYEARYRINFSCENYYAAESHLKVLIHLKLKNIIKKHC